MAFLKLRTELISALTLVLSGCSLAPSDKFLTTPSGSQGPRSPTGITLTSSQPLTFSILNEAGALSPTGSGVIATAGPLSTTTTPIVPNIAGINTTATTPLVTSSNIATIQSASLPARDATQNSRNLTLTVDGVHDFTTCSFASPFASLACNLAGLSVTASQLPTLGSLAAQIGSTISNSLPVTRYMLNQVSNTSGNANLDDEPFQIYPFTNELYFFARNSSNAFKLFRYNPTSNTILQLSNSRNDQTLSDALNNGLFQIIEYNSELALSLHNQNGNIKLHRYLRASNTLEQIANTNNDQASGDLADRFAIYNSKLYFRANIPTTGRSKAFVYDSAGAGSVRHLTNTKNSTSVNDTWSAPFASGGALYFWAYGEGETLNYKLFKYVDSPVESLVRISNTSGDNTLRDSPFGASEGSGNTIAYNNRIFFQGRNPSAVSKLFRYNDPTGEVIQISNTSGSALAPDFSTSANSMIVYNNKLFFSGLNSSGVSKLHVYDDTVGTLRQISNTSANAATPDSPSQFRVMGSTLYFSALNDSGVSKLYSYHDATGVMTLVSNTSGNNAMADSVGNLTVYNSKLYFTANNSSAQTKLYVFDPTTNTISQVTNTSGSQATPDSTQWLTVLSDRLYFSSLNSNGRRKLYSICDTSAGCGP